MGLCWLFLWLEFWEDLLGGFFLFVCLLGFGGGQVFFKAGCFLY